MYYEAYKCTMKLPNPTIDVILFSFRAIKNKNLSYDMIEMMDPSVMFAIPRLAILW